MGKIDQKPQKLVRNWLKMKTIGKISKKIG